MNTEPPSKLTIVEEIYYQVSPNEDPYQISTKVSRELKTKEQIWSRKCRATEQWKPLDLGWLEGLGCSLIAIENHAGTFNQVQPTKEELEIEAKKILCLSYEKNDLGFLIYPQATEKFVPVVSDALTIRCKEGETDFTIWAIPL